MEENLKVSENYKKWFNRGYELQKSMPIVLNGMTMQGTATERSEAFNAGRKQYELDCAHEIEKEKDAAILARLQRKRTSKNRGRDR